MKEFLDSDRVNFLIWRYLLEANYRETAAKFQKEWHIQEPHRHFDFAPHVKSHALVSVVNRGLLYHSLEREFTQSQVPRDAAAAPEAEPLGIFGPLVVQPPLHKEEEEAEAISITAAAEEAPETALAAAAAAAATPAVPAAATVVAEDDTQEKAATAAATALVEDVELSRKRQIDKQQASLANGSPAAKRQRLSNGFENGADAATTTPMEIDSHGDTNNNNNHAYPSPMEGEPAQTPILRSTDGPDQGTQIDKVEELATETIFLRLMTDNESEAAAATATATATATASASTTTTASATATTPGPQAGTAETSANNNENPIVLHCEWNPRDPSSLAAAGTDALARVWTVSRATDAELAADDHVNGVNRPFNHLVDDDLPPTSTVTAMAWSWDGSNIAVATESGNKARISICAADGSELTRIDVQEPPVIKIRWNPNNLSILGIAPEGRGSVVTVFSAATATSTSYSLPNHDLNHDPLDAAWTSENEFLLCGGDLLVSLRYTGDAIVENRHFDVRKDDSFSLVQFDWRSRLAATASEKGVIDLWDETGQRRSISAHIGVITSLMWQPLESNPPEDERLLASGGEDGAISIWNARLPDNKPKCSMTMDLPVAALAFTPDGAFIAGATTDRILIWKVGEHAIPRASWSRAPHPGWLSPKMDSDSDVEDTHYCLSWDANGQKLAFGANSRLAVINFR